MADAGNHHQLFVVFMYHQILGTNDRSINKESCIVIIPRKLLHCDWLRAGQRFVSLSN